MGLVLFGHLSQVFLAFLPDQPARYNTGAVWSALRNEELLVQTCASSSKGLLRQEQVRDPVGDVVTFVEEYERSYGTNHPPFHRGSYAQVSIL